jgi:hypothetical protein
MLINKQCYVDNGQLVSHNDPHFAVAIHFDKQRRHNEGKGLANHEGGVQTGYKKWTFVIEI